MNQINNHNANFTWFADAIIQNKFTKLDISVQLQSFTVWLFVGVQTAIFGLLKKIRHLQMRGGHVVFQACLRRIQLIV